MHVHREGIELHLVSRRNRAGISFYGRSLEKGFLEIGRAAFVPVHTLKDITLQDFSKSTSRFACYPMEVL